MALASRIAELKKKHQQLSDAVEAAQRSPGSSDEDITRMKKEKLQLKEEIGRLSLG